MNDMQDASPLEATLINKALASRIPINSSFELSPLCNLDCRMCFVRLSRSEMEEKGRLLTSDEWYSIACRLRDAGTLFLLLTGGEPLLYPDFPDLYIRLRQLGFILTVNTNGTMINEEMADFFAKNKPRRINLTLYGASRNAYEKTCGDPNGFDKAVNAIKLLFSKGVDVKVNFSATDHNVNETDEILALCDRIGVPVNIDTYMYPVTRERDRDYDHSSRLSPQTAASVWIKSLKHSMPESALGSYVKGLLRSIDDTGSSEKKRPVTGTACLAARCSLTINWQGMMRPCVMLGSPEISALEGDLQAAWSSLCDKTSLLRIPEKCGQCHLRPICRICPANADLEISYDGKPPEYLCSLAECTYNELLTLDRKLMNDEQIL